MTPAPIRYYDDSSCSYIYTFDGQANNQCIVMTDNDSVYYAYPTAYFYRNTSTCSGNATEAYPLDSDAGVCLENEYVSDDDSFNGYYTLLNCTSSVTAVLFVPTFAPTRKPTASDTSMPTYDSSYARSLTYNVTQLLDNIDSATYNADWTLNNEVLVDTVVQYMKGVDDANVIVLSAVDPVANLTLLRRRLQANSSTSVTYTVNIPNTATAGYSSGYQAYNATVTTLTMSLTMGYFTPTLQDTAFALGASNMQSATSNSASASVPVIYDLGDDDFDIDIDLDLDDGAIAGIVIGVVVAVAIIVVLLYYCVFRRKDPEAQALTKATPAASAPAKPVLELSGSTRS